MPLYWVLILQYSGNVVYMKQSLLCGREYNDATIELFPTVQPFFASVAIYMYFACSASFVDTRVSIVLTPGCQQRPISSEKKKGMQMVKKSAATETSGIWKEATNVGAVSSIGYG